MREPTSDLGLCNRIRRKGWPHRRFRHRKDGSPVWVREAVCGANVPTCTANEYGLLAYWNYRIGAFDNLSLRTEFYNDMKGQRTGFATRYVDVGLGWQHWFGPQVEVRPEVTYYRSIDQAAFSNGTQHNELFTGDDVIWHF